jgi:alpha-N-arabinofuranosidase
MPNPPSPTPARISLDPDRVVGPLSPLLFGGFVEHLGRCVYGGVYDPGSPHADAQGFRTDVLAALADMNLATIRYPGGNYVSGADWRDGVGPREHRPRRRELAWQSVETNQFGLNEFVTLCRRLKCEPMLGLNFGTQDLADASDLVEYCNAPRGTRLADRRALHGFPDPHGVKYWCLGNEMDGPWQIGQMDAHHYGRKALECAKIIKWHTPDAKTIVCGSSGPGMATFPEWDRVVLEQAWEKSDYLAMHHYADNWAGDTPSFLATSVALEEHLAVTEATMRYVKAKLRSRHDVRISWDEWNVWYKDRDGDGKWQEAPHLCEEVYNLEDALVVAQWLSLFLRHADTVHITCIAQVVNVIAPLLTTRDKLLKQSTWYPFHLFAKYARGVSLSPHVVSPKYVTKKYGDQPLLDASATADPGTGRLSLFVVNRSTTDNLPLEVRLPGLTGGLTQFQEVHQLAGRDPKAANSFDKPDLIVPQALRPVAIQNGAARLLLPPLSFTVLSGTP